MGTMLVFGIKLQPCLPPTFAQRCGVVSVFLLLASIGSCLFLFCSATPSKIRAQNAADSQYL